MYYLVYSINPTDHYYPRERVAFVIGMDHLRGLARELVPWPISRRDTYQDVADILAMYDFDVLKLTKAQCAAVRPQDIRSFLEGGRSYA